MEIVSGDAWFARELVAPGLWRLWEPFVDDFARCNIWYLVGRDRSVLIDSGLGLVSLANAARDLFEQNLVAVATHYHFDHVGSLHEFADRRAHREADHYLQSSERIGGALSRRGYPARSWQSFLDAGYSPADELLTAWPRADLDPDAYAVAPCRPTTLLEDGDVIDLGDRALRVLHLPGHSPDSIGLYDESEGVLFSGDAVYDGPLLDGGSDADIEAYVATMHRLRTLPVRVVHGGHRPSFGRERLVELCDGYTARAGSNR